MIVFSVVKEPFGWAIRAGGCMTTTFRTRDCALKEAHCLASAIRSHGQATKVIILDEDEIDLSHSRLRAGQILEARGDGLRG